MELADANRRRVRASLNLSSPQLRVNHLIQERVRNDLEEIAVAEIRSFPFLPANHKTTEIQQQQAPFVKKVMGYRVDTVPLPVRPLYLAAAWACGVVLYLYYFLCRKTSRVSIEGPGEEH